MFDTITAISSGNVNQAISIIRIVGPEAINIIKKIFTGKIGKDKTIEYGFIKDQNDSKIDEVLVSFFIGKNNFIGEDTIEINAHGGIVVTNKILDLIIAHGARLANPGEFTRRAYLNGKMSLIKAEAINDLIHSKTSKQHEIAINAFDKTNEKTIVEFIKDLEYLIGLCEINIDYPEYDDIPVLENVEFTKKIDSIITRLEKIKQSSEANQVFSHSLNVAIVGNPNAGKSSLLNAILNYEKSIVTSVPGTTRDVVESEVIFNNYILRFKDTAGIRKSNDEVEKIGIEKSWKEIENANIVLHVIDSTKQLNEIDKKIEELSSNKNYIQLFNKADCLKKLDKNKIYISAANKEISKLEEALNNLFKIESIDLNNSYNTRQTGLIKKALVSLKEGKKAISENHTYDVVIIDLHHAWESLKEILGDYDKDDLLDSIFSNFCLGK